MADAGDGHVGRLEGAELVEQLGDRLQGIGILDVSGLVFEDGDEYLVAFTSLVDENLR